MNDPQERLSQTSPMVKHRLRRQQWNDQIAKLKVRADDQERQINELLSMLDSRDARLHALELQVKQLENDRTVLSPLTRRLAFHTSGKPRWWLRRLLLSDQKGTPRKIARRILFKKNGIVREIFTPWYNTFDTQVDTPPIEANDGENYVDFINAQLRSGQLGNAISLHIITTLHTKFIGNSIARSLECTRFEVNIAHEMPKNFDHDLYIVVCPQMFNTMPPRNKSILVQMEQVRASRWLDNRYSKQLNNCLIVLDYANDNVTALTQNGLSYRQIYHLPILPIELNAAESKARDIDILFYGAVNSDRRRSYLKALKGKFDIRVESELFGEPLSDLLARTKVVVNVHFYEDAILETTRISEALSHGAHVVSEVAADQDDHTYFAGCVDFVPIGDIDRFVERVERCLAEWSGPQRLPNFSFYHSTTFYLLRALHGCGVLSWEELLVATKGFDLPSDRLVLALPEQSERYCFARSRLLEGSAVFPGLRHVLGWKGCALSYKFIASKAIEQDLSRLLIYEDDADFEADVEHRLELISDYLDKQANNWDIFSGLLSDLHPDAEITAAEQIDGMTAVHIDSVIGMVFGIYNQSALRLIAAFQFEGEDAAKHTIDRYLESHRLHCITTSPPLAHHCVDLESTLWPSTNAQMTGMIDRSIARLERKYRKFVCQDR